MSLQYCLRLALVGLTLSVVGSWPEVSKGDVTDDSKIKIQALESFKSVNPPIENPIRGSLQRNIEPFNSKYQLPWISSASYNQRNDLNAKNPSFSPTDTRASADVIYSVPNKVQSNIRNNSIELSSAKFNNEIDAERSYAFQTVQQEQNPLDFKGSQMSSSDVNLAPRLVREKGGMHANMHRSGSFGYQHISKSEMHSDSSKPLGLNEPYLRENIPTNYMSRSSTVNHNIRHKSDGNMLLEHFLQNNGQNQNVLRRVVPANTSPSIVTANQQKSQPLPQAFSEISQISYENMRDVALSKVFKPPTIPTPISPVFKRLNSNGGHSILPLKKSQMFSSQHDHIKLSNSERVANPKANRQSSFEYGNTKSAAGSYTLKNIQLTQNGYQSRGQSSQNVVPIQTFHNQKKYDNLATGISPIRPSVTNNARSYILSDENGGIQMSALLKRSKQNTDLTPRMQFSKNTMLFSERDKNINLPDPTNHSLRKPSQHNTQNRTHLNSFGQSTVQSLSIKHHPAPSLVPGSTMKSHIHSISPSVSGTQGASKNSGTSRRRNTPYYLTSKKPYAFKGFTFVPTLQTSLQKSEMHSGQKPLLKFSSNVQSAPARPHTTQSALAQKPLMRESYEKTLFQFKDIESSQEIQPYWDQTDSFDNGSQRETISSTEGASNPMSDALKHHVVRVQAVAMKTSLSGTDTTSNGAVDEVQSKTSQRWTSSAQPTKSNQDESPTVRFSNGSFVGSNLNKPSIKSSKSHNSPTSELILPIHKSSLMNKVTGYPQIHNAVIQPLRKYGLKEHEGVLYPTKEIKKSNTTENYSSIRLRPTSSVVIGRQTEDNSDHQNIYAIPASQSAIYRSADVNGHKTKLTFQSPMHRSAMKPTGKVNILQANAASDWRNETSQISEADINLSAVGVSQALRPTSSFVVGKNINIFDKTSTKSNLNMSSTKSGLNNYKPVRFLDIAGSASFTDVKPHSADTKANEEVDLESDQNSTNSTSVMEESFKELVFDSSSMISALQSAMDLRVPELMPTAAIDFTTQSQLSFAEEHSRPQPTVYSSESQLDPGNHTTPTAEDIDPVYVGTLIPNTTLQDKMTSG